MRDGSQNRRPPYYTRPTITRLMPRPATSRLRVKVQPNAARSEIVGWHGGALRMRTTSPPLRGEANQAATRMLARVLEIPRTDVAVLRGHGSRDKVMEIVGMDEPEMMRRLSDVMDSKGRTATTR